MELHYPREIKEQEEDSNLSIHDIIHHIGRYWKWFAVSVLICLAAGVFYAMKQTPTFNVYASILIKSKEDSNPMQNQMDVLDNSSLLGMKDNVLDEIEVINSKLLLTKVVNQLKLHTTYFRNKGLKELELYQNSPICVSMLPENQDTLAAPVIMNIKCNNGKISVEGQMKKGTFSSVKFEKTFTSLPAAISTPMGIIRLTASKQLSEGNYKVTLLSPFTAASALQNSLSVELKNKKANVITLSATTKDIRKGQDIIASLIHFYNEASIEEKNKTAYNSIKFINERLGLITGELTDVEKQVENYKQANKLTDIQQESKLYIEQTGDYDKLRLDNETQLNLVQFVDQYIRKEENKFGIVPNIGLKDEALLNVLNEYNKILFQRERLIRTTAADNPVIVDLDRQIRSMRTAIFASIESSRKGLLIAKQNLEQQGSTVSSRIKSVPRQEREFLEIKRQQEIKAALYTYLLQKREENSLTLAISVPAARIIESPIPDDKPASKGASFFLVIALIAGLILPVFVIIPKEILNVRLSEKSQLERMTDVTILGELPDYNGNDTIVVRPGNREPIAEMYRLMRTNLQFILNDKHKKVINITSTEPGEGKSTFSINMAMTLALTGKKVIMVGLDIRKPSLASYINMTDEHGITSYLSGHHTNLEKLVKKTHLHENLFILPAGTVPPNPNELLLRESLDDLFAILRKDFDYIVVDTAPVGLVSDTFLLDRIADATLYIFRLNYSHKNNIKIINDIAKNKKLKNMYIALKGCNLKSNPYGYGKGKNGYYGNK
ncbi:GumC family protein [Parabacteroides sp. FAFU027]|uniref:GumC family protein n=1 Tax=Parabacteroides sp. FAFU027 TaxID=2922715 RepID=UPI001FAEF700|nr:tyrosine-protein kinase [Parabacteroides sp. FAFU027]